MVYKVFCYKCGSPHLFENEQENGHCPDCNVPFITKSAEALLGPLFTSNTQKDFNTFVRGSQKNNNNNNNNNYIELFNPTKKSGSLRQTLNVSKVQRPLIGTRSSEVSLPSLDSLTDSSDELLENKKDEKKEKKKTILTFRKRNEKEKEKEEGPEGKFIRVEKTGNLVKQGAVVHSWKTRWFILKVHEKLLLLEYYSSQKSQNPKGMITLDHHTTIEHDTSRKKDYCFKIDHQVRRTWYLVANDKKTLDDWISILQKEVKYLIRRDSFALGNSLDLKKSIRKATEIQPTNLNYDIEANHIGSHKSRSLKNSTEKNPPVLIRTISSALNKENSPVLSKNPQMISKEKQFLNICAKMKVELDIKDRTWRFQEYKNCFVASECVDWILRNLVSIQSRPEAVSFAQNLLAEGWIQHVALKPQFEDGEFYYIFIEPKFEKAKIPNDETNKLKYLSQFIQANSWVKPNIIDEKNIVLLIDVNPVIASELAKLLIDAKHFPRLLYRKEHPSVSDFDLEFLFSLGASVYHFDFQDQNQNLSSFFKDVDKIVFFSEIGTDLEHLNEETEIILKYAEQEKVTQIIKTLYLGFGDSHFKSIQTLKNSSIPVSVVKHSSYMQNFLVDGIKATKTFSLPFPETTKISWIDLRDLSKLLALLITNPKPLSRNFTLTGPEALDPLEISQKISAISYKTVTFIQSDINELVSWLKEQGRPNSVLNAHLKLVNSHIEGETSVVSADYQIISRWEPTPFSQFCVDYIDVLREDYLKYFNFGSQQLTVLYNQFNRMKETKYQNLNEEVIPKKNFETIMSKILQDEQLANVLFNSFQKGQRNYLRFSDYAEGVGIIMKGSPEEKLNLASNMFSEVFINEQEFIYSIQVLHHFIHNKSLSLSHKTELDTLFNEISKNYPNSNFPKIELVSLSNNSLIKKLILNENPVSLLEPTNKCISFGHESWDLAENMLLGIQISLEENTSQKVIQDPASEQSEFTILQDKSSSTIISYAPQIFSLIREEYKLKDEDFKTSFKSDKLLGALEEVVSTGKSGSFLYRTTDRKYLLKTLPEDEALFFLKFIQSYFIYLKKNRDTLLTRYFGLFKLNTKDLIVYFVVMKNIFYTPLNISEVYDLKGSTVNRMEKEEIDSPDPTRALKDLNFKKKLRFGNELKTELISQLRSDVKFLEGWNIIDYSFLVGIHSHERTFTSRNLTTKHDSKWNKYNGGILSRQGSPKEVYFIGLVDLLTEFNLLKRGEYVTKTLFLTTGRAEAEVSAVPPKQYAERFLKYIDSIIV